MKKAITTLIRILSLGGFFLVVATVAGFVAYCTAILMWKTPDQTLTKSEAIIVLTGSKGRIEAGFDLLLQDKAPRLLVSGVIDHISFQELVNARDMSKKDKDRILEHCCVDIDYVADTTETNATESAKWIEEKHVKNIILVTSFLHMPRAYLLYTRTLPKDVTITTYPVRTGTRSETITSKEFWVYAGREYAKYLGNWLRLERNNT